MFNFKENFASVDALRAFFCGRDDAFIEIQGSKAYVDDFAYDVRISWDIQEDGSLVYNSHTAIEYF
jgi:hypothetical protein